MRIGIVTETYVPSTNGVVVSIETFRKELEQRGHRVFVFAPEFPGYTDTEERKEFVYRFPSIRFAKYPDYPVVRPFPPGLPALFKELGLDIVHVQHIFVLCNAAVRAARTLDIPVIHTEHTLIAEYSQYGAFLKSFYRPYLIWLIRRFCNRCDQIIAPSEAMKTVVKSYKVTTPIAVNPTGIDVSGYHRPDPEPLRKQYKIPQNGELLLYVGRLANEKNIQLLLDVIQKLRDQHRVVQLAFVGDGPQRADFERYVAKNGLKDHVTFTGILPHDEVMKLFGAAKIFVFPSLTDTQGIVIAEALAAGTPVVAANRMGPTNVVVNGKCGYLVEPNVSSFVDSIGKLMDNRELWNTMSRQAKARAAAFSTSATAERLQEIYAQTITHYRSRRSS